MDTNQQTALITISQRYNIVFAHCIAHDLTPLVAHDHALETMAKEQQHFMDTIVRHAMKHHRRG